MTEQLVEPQTDEALLAAIAERDEAAFEQFYDRFAPQGYAVCLRILSRPLDAQAVLSEVFWEIWQNATRFNPQRGSVRTYFMMMLRSRSIDKLRSEAGRTTHETKYSQQQSVLDTTPQEEAPVERVIAGENSEQLAVALQELSEIQQQALHLAYFEGKTHREIAELLDTPLGTIKTHIRQGLIKLGSLLRTMNSSWTDR